MDLFRLIYRSQPFGFDEATLNGILASARRNNPSAAITGALICRADLYLQLLEGPETAVTALAERIRGDNRHLAMTVITAGTTSERLFPRWDMLDDPARSWMWDQAEVAAGALDRASPQDLFDVFARVARETH